MVNEEIRDILIRFYGGDEADIRKNMRFEMKKGRVHGRYTNNNGGYFYEGEVSCADNGSDLMWEIPHRYEKQ